MRVGRAIDHGFSEFILVVMDYDVYILMGTFKRIRQQFYFEIYYIILEMIDFATF